MMSREELCKSILDEFAYKNARLFYNKSYEYKNFLPFIHKEPKLAVALYYLGELSKEEFESFKLVNPSRTMLFSNAMYPGSLDGREIKGIFLDELIELLPTDLDKNK